MSGWWWLEVRYFFTMTHIYMLIQLWAESQASFWYLYDQRGKATDIFNLPEMVEWQGGTRLLNCICMVMCVYIWLVNDNPLFILDLCLFSLKPFQWLLWYHFPRFGKIVDTVRRLSRVGGFKHLLYILVIVL